MDLQADLEVLFREFAVPWSKGASSFLGILDAPGQVLAVGNVNVVANMYALTAKTADAESVDLQNGDTITVDGKSFDVRELLALDDGLITNVTLSRR